MMPEFNSESEVYIAIVHNNTDYLHQSCLYSNNHIYKSLFQGPQFFIMILESIFSASLRFPLQIERTCRHLSNMPQPLSLISDASSYIQSFTRIRSLTKLRGCDVRIQVFEFSFTHSNDCVNLAACKVFLTHQVLQELSLLVRSCSTPISGRSC